MKPMPLITWRRIALAIGVAGAVAAAVYFARREVPPGPQTGGKPGAYAVPVAAPWSSSVVLPIVLGAAALTLLLLAVGLVMRRRRQKDTRPKKGPERPRTPPSGLPLPFEEPDVEVSSLPSVASAALQKEAKKVVADLPATPPSIEAVDAQLAGMLKAKQIDPMQMLALAQIKRGLRLGNDRDLKVPGFEDEASDPKKVDYVRVLKNVPAWFMGHREFDEYKRRLSRARGQTLIDTETFVATMLGYPVSRADFKEEDPSVHEAHTTVRFGFDPKTNKYDALDMSFSFQYETQKQWTRYTDIIRHNTVDVLRDLSRHLPGKVFNVVIAEPTGGTKALELRFLIQNGEVTTELENYADRAGNPVPP